MDAPLTKPPFADPLEGIPVWLRNVFSDEFFGDIGTMFLDDRAHLSQAKSLSRIRHLFSVPEVSIDDDDLDALASFPYLESIVFFNTEITDAGLEKLQKIRSLKEIFIGDSKVTADGHNEFDRAFVGKCTIITTCIQPEERLASGTGPSLTRRRGRHVPQERYRPERRPGGPIDLSKYPDSVVDSAVAPSSAAAPREALSEK
jgi:hypothetical protein